MESMDDTHHTRHIQQIITNMEVVDFHSHILPGADHGSSSVETSIKQLDNAIANGVKRIVATPHFYPTKHLLDDFLSRRERSYSKLKDALTAHSPEIRIGAEVLVCEGISRMPGIEKLCIEGTNTILLELPFTKLGDRHFRMVSEVYDLGFNVVLAHADRYNHTFINSLLNKHNISVQINASAISGLFIPRHIKNWFKNNRVCAIGSDVHGSSATPYIKFRKAVKKIGKYADYVKEQSDIIWEKTKAHV